MLKDKKISLIKMVECENEIGDTELQEKEFAKVWAYYRHATSKELIEAQKINTRINAVFIINWRNDLDTKMKIKYKNDIYEIFNIDDFEGYKRDIKLYAYREEQ